MVVGAVNSQSSQIVKAKDTLSSNYETFLRLLTTQLQNQDPLEPQDATKFTEQLVSYSQVEQQIATNSSLDALIALTKSAAGSNAVSYLGKNAFTAGPVSSLVDGQASWQYSLPRDAASIQINVTDLSGHVLRTLPAADKVGAHSITWDGKNSSGTQLPDGSYRLSIVAKSADDKNISAAVSGAGVISEIDMSGIEPLVSIGTRKLNLSEIIGFKN